MAVLLTSIAELEAALGKDLTVSEEARATYYINTISAFIASYCDLVNFTEVEDDVVKGQADYYGIIELGGGPISSVASVTDVDNAEVGDYFFDGLSRILGLNPFQVVNITFTHGLDAIPEDLEAVATEAVVQLLSLQVSGPVTRRTVGDVTYAYQEGRNIGVTLSQHVLNQYRTTSFTMRIGSPYERGFSYPPNWFQISG